MLGAGHRPVLHFPATGRAVVGALPSYRHARVPLVPEPPLRLTQQRPQAAHHLLPSNVVAITVTTLGRSLFFPAPDLARGNWT